MPKVIVRKCPITKKVFFGDDEYATHIVALRNRTNLERKHNRYRKEAQARIWNALENEVDDIPALEQFVINNLHDIFIAYNGGRPEVNDAVREAKLEQFDIDVSYNETVRNTHDCPRNGERNFGQNGNAPCHYPGFVGRIEYSLINDPDKDPRMENGKLRTCMSFNDALGYIGIHTGSGNGPSSRGRYQVTLFQDDFIAIRRAVFKAKLQDNDPDTIVCVL